MQALYPNRVSFEGQYHEVSVVAATGGGNDTLAIDDKGVVWACGRNAAGQLGVNNTLAVYLMTKFPLPTQRCVGYVRDFYSHTRRCLDLTALPLGESTHTRKRT